MKRSIRISFKLVLLWVIVTLSHSAMAQSKAPVQGKTSDKLLNDFVNPPNDARPRVWWHWMNGNISKEGIEKDLKWMNSTGIGGFQNFDAALQTPQIVKNRLIYMTPEWKDAFLFTTRLADSLKLEMAIAGSPGWSESGGPWVKPEDGMKKIVWTETRVKGGDANIKLAQSTGITGPFQNIPMQPVLGIPVDQSKLPSFYKDIAVVAFKLPTADKSLRELGAEITSSGGNFTLTQLTDGDLGKTNLLPSDSVKGFAWIQFAFAQPQNIKAITMVGGGEPGMFGQGAAAADSRTLETCDDGVNFKIICHIPPGAILQQTIAIPETTAKYFRVTVKNPPVQSNPFAAMLGIVDKPVASPGTEIAEIVLHPASRINRFEEKDAFAPSTELYAKVSAATNDVVAEQDILDLTGKLNADGSLNWNVPAGEWKVVRFGYSLLGIENHPASPEATGLEVDKLDPVAVKTYFTNYLDQYKSATGGLMGDKGGLQYIVTDSWEAGAQNWTANLPNEFQKRRGYSLIHWMPVLTGQVVKSAGASEQFLFDFRHTLSELVAEYHYDALTSILAERGMKRYSESHESGRALIADGMDVKRKAAVPMSAMWTPGMMNNGDLTGYTADIRESASVAHIYGQNLVAAESLTAFGLGGTAWSYDPQKLKPTADLELASGLNRFVIHCSPHQPVDDKIPGLGLGPFGQWFTRHETWAEQAKAWTDYLSRSSYMLQQGKFVADVVYYYGEDNNITSLFGRKLPAVPEGYNFDFVNPDALINILSVKDGKIVTPSGMSYQVLVLDSNARKMSLPVLRKLSTLVKAGATIAGVQPEGTPSLSDSQDEFNKLVKEIWGSSNKKVMTGKPLSEVLSALNIAPDFTYTKPQADTKVMWVHRSATDREIYWVDNRIDRVQNIDVTFRVAGKVPQLWNPETGLTEKLSYSISKGFTKVKLNLEPNQAVFVVFKDKATKTAEELPEVKEKQLATIKGEWVLNFQKDRGAPAAIKVNELSSWTNSTDEGVKYFSGTGTYTKSIDASAAWFAKDARILLDLGDVKNLAEVIVNGKSLGVIWKKPFRVDITTTLKQGKNILEVKVTNLWVNRLIGDEQPGVTNKITYTTMTFYQANSPLLPSGLIGPVKVVQLTK